ncbi:MAG: PQQ-binding-like beta-propeller repeat protein [Gammaproteobacteria bacterium]|nr:PQQ-binding-like beta-propeller repeat protein [Gammaproteobacteria bacterium]
MKLGHNNVHSRWIALSALTTCLIGGSAMAAPGAIANKPLILETTPVQPNIFFLVDDSGSMNWESLLNEGTQYPAEAPVSGLDFSPDDALEKRLLCRGFNVMAYDPNVTYKPWAGTDSAGNAYTDLTLTTARNNPYSTTTSDISSHVYVKWTDSDKDDAYDGPGSTNISSSSSTGDECDIANTVSVSTLTAAQQKNYANWYSYYRKREYVAKRALSQIIKDSSARVGLGTLHNHNSVRTAVKDIDDITTPVDTTAQTNKNNLLKNVFNITSSNGTPLRSALVNAGEYFAGNLASTWGASPILSAADGGECQKNFTILMSDGFWNGTSPSVGNTDKGSGPWDGGSHEDKVSNTLADVAMKYYETDLSTLANKVGKIPGVDENTAQHLVTYTVAFGVNGTLTANPPNRTDAFSWPTPSADEPTTIDDMRHAAWNGRGQFLSAGDPQKLITSLQAAIKDIDSRSGSSAAAALNTTSLQTGSLIFMASYDSTSWLGNLSAIEIDKDGKLGSLKWEAGQKLNAIATADLMTTRKIYTYDGTTSQLLNSLNINAGQKADLLVDKPGAESDDAYVSRMIKYIYGDHTDEVGGAGLQYFRNRIEQRLGDIVHSAPQYIGVPNTPYPDAIEGAHLYSTFKTSQASRDGTVFVGSNDGMLHAFNAKTGAERFAYIPNMLFSTAAGKGLHALTDPVYEHKYYVDLTPTVADVYTDDWKTMLIGGLRGGGKGIFALDVTTEGSMSVQFEFTHADLGYTFSEIQVAKMNNGKWAAVFGNGYNNTGDGKAKLFIVYLDKSGSKILDTGTGSINNSDCADADSDCNGLSTPALADLNGDGRIDRVYAGDVQGNMWSFNVSSATESEWKLAYDGGKPLFTACRSTTSPCTAADRQPITSKPALARHPDQRSAATFTNVMIMFGTGQFITSNDVTDTSTQSVYGVWDRGDSELSPSDLVEQTVSSSVSTDAIPIRVITDLSVTYTTDVSTTDHGWYFDLPTSKERVVVNPVTYGDLLFVNTMIPESPQICDNSGGIGWLMAVDIFNGGEPDFAPLDVNNDAVFNDSDGNTSNKFAVGTQINGIPTESKFVSDKRITVDSNKNVNVESVQGLPPGNPSRMSWTTL